MGKLLRSVIVEAIVGISLAGLVLAIVIPALNRYRPDAGDFTATAVIVGVLVGVLAAVLLRPNSAISRWLRR
jgi:membrane associated rhomboid family serine protease